MFDIYEKIQYNHLTEELQMLAEVTGMPVLREILKRLRGVQIYIPHISRLDSFIDEYFINNRQRSLKVLARELQISEQHLRNVRKRVNEQNKCHKPINFEDLC